MNKKDKRLSTITRLMEKGVRIPCPDSVEIGEDVLPERISGEGVVIHTGCKIFGSDTLIMPGVTLGFEEPVTINNCQIGEKVELKGGYFSGSTFLNRASFGSGSHIRESCLIEEKARGAHTVGLKHTILFPFVTLGSLINFCDCLMAGGTDEKNHSEVGSSYIHFNYTPNQDKATASLIGDVPRGVMLNQNPIFLGGQGGLVGPVNLEYGVVIAAGTIARKDITKENSILLGNPSLPKSIPFHPEIYSNIKRIIRQNSIYITNLIALRAWYLSVRSVFFKSNRDQDALLNGALAKIESAINERINRLGEVAVKISESIELNISIAKEPSQLLTDRKREFTNRWPEMKDLFNDSFEESGDSGSRDEFLKIIGNSISENGKDYLTVIRRLKREEAETGTLWLQSIVNSICGRVWALLPGMGLK